MRYAIPKHTDPILEASSKYRAGGAHFACNIFGPWWSNPRLGVWNFVLHYLSIKIQQRGSYSTAMTSHRTASQSCTGWLCRVDGYPKTWHNLNEGV